MKLDIGTPVRYPDGEQVGTINRVIFDPDTATVYEIVVETPDLVGRMALVEVTDLREDPGDVLTYTGDRDTFAGLPTYEVERFMDPPEGWTAPENYMPGEGLFPNTMHYPLVPVYEESNAPEGSVEWSQGTEVICTDGRVGVVDEVQTDDNGRISHVVVRLDDDAGRLLIPLDMVTEADSQTVQLTCTRAELDAQAEAYSDPGAESEPESLVPTT
ncbi:MAG TPA: PRC-barrel domain-containing protein [Chloroflexia bacterium]|nr:PRC-barrel domain-containing protein [Chloroflexia bacterium]